MCEYCVPPNQQHVEKTVIVSWCGYGREDGCGYVCTEGTSYCHHCGRPQVERVELAVKHYLGRVI